MDKEKMNWRSFAHQEAINAKWNPSTPSYYVLDPRGVIRHKWVGAPGEKALDKAMERLIGESENEDKQPGTPELQYKELLKKYNEAFQDYAKAYREAKTAA